MSRSLNSNLFCAIAVATALAAPLAHAQSINATQVVNGSGACSGATKAYDDSLRRQPLMLRNESTSNVFVTCAPQQFAESRNYSLYMQFLNQGTTTSTTTCTLVSTPGAGTGTPVYTTYQLALLGGASGRMNLYAPSGTNSYGLIHAVSCNLPGKHAIGEIEIDGSLTAEVQP